MAIEIPIVSVDQEAIKAMDLTLEGIKGPITPDIKEEDTIIQQPTVVFGMRAADSEMKVAASETKAQGVFEMRAAASEMRVAVVSEAVKTQDRITIGMKISLMRNLRKLEVTFHPAVLTPKTKIIQSPLPWTRSRSPSFQPPNPSSPYHSQPTM